jgi:ribosomal protein S18 acetylase RimI-like enzyme
MNLQKKINIRSALASDLNAIGMLWAEFMDFHRDRDPHFERASDGIEQFIKFIGEQINDNASCVFVAEDSKEIVGYCLAKKMQDPKVFKERDFGMIFDLAVTKNYRRIGIGEKLYQEAELWLKTQGMHRIEIRVVITNEVSVSFWNKMGYCPYVTTGFKNI